MILNWFSFEYRNVHPDEFNIHGLKDAVIDILFNVPKMYVRGCSEPVI